MQYNIAFELLVFPMRFFQKNVTVCQGWNYRLVIDGVILYFSFIEYRFVFTFYLSISNPAIRLLPKCNALQRLLRHIDRMRFFNATFYALF